MGDLQCDSTCRLWAAKYTSEIAMVAYVACATVAYTLWWHKPKDMISPMTIFLPYDRHVEDMPDFVRVILESRPKNWASLTNILLQEESTLVWKTLGFIWELDVLMWNKAIAFL
ncbi:uncharacterized protein ATNIH1004_008128 [Aspergillus tanneri]|uniref:Uncharacterized protein n=1 Tax=Aspergillus tanneri TaxID=1220188 RepID=A0A5M9MA66_9EURO|nr:uncharacterized protein ATNIH1004_008128 [Aspergillus tanneri]KAA8643932.1 hypothetical protein ATNIH1004_008128 [Aspergillus tanneri]